MGENEIAISHVTDTTALPPAERQVLLTRFDAITDLIWRKPSDIFQRLESWVCGPDTGILLARSHQTEIVGFSVYRRLALGAALVIHRETTNIVPGVQGRGVWTAFTRRLLNDLGPTASGRPLHLAFRTRNPVIYMANYRYCESVAPDLIGGSTDRALIDLAVCAAERLYPQLRLDRTSMVMSHAYGGFAYREPPCHHDPRVTARFFAVPGLAPPDSALFALGRVRS
jgi:hypothetical protein